MKPLGKGKKTELADTRPVRPVSEHVHWAVKKFKVHVHKGTVEELLVCECGQMAKLGEGPVPGFHARKRDEP